MSKDRSNLILKCQNCVHVVYDRPQGRCYTFIFHDLFKQLEPVICLKIKASEKLKIFFHSPGEEVWLYPGYWPKRPQVLDIGGFQGSIDIGVRKSINVNCPGKSNAKRDGNLSGVIYIFFL